MDLPSHWQPEAEGLLRVGGVAVLIGRTDTGKSTLTRWISDLAVEARREVAVVDADIGQSSFGPATCISLTYLPSKGPAVLRFIGATHPVGHFLEVIVGTKLLVDRARAAGAGLILVDTSGMVQGPLGMLLKRHKVELVRPDHLLVLQKAAELEGLLSRLPILPQTAIRRLPVSPEARVRSIAERRAHRQRQFAEYFQEASFLSIGFGRGSPILHGPRPGVGRLVGLLDGTGETVGMGRVQHRDRGSITLLTPVRSVASIRHLQVGSLRLREDWTEVPKA